MCKVLSQIIENRTGSDVRNYTDLSDEWFGNLKSETTCDTTCWDLLRQQIITYDNKRHFTINAKNYIVGFSDKQIDIPIEREHRYIGETITSPSTGPLTIGRPGTPFHTDPMNVGKEH